jgi:hypothetical protein
MGLKKVNAVLSLLSALLLLVHMGYNAYAYLTFTYNPMLKALTALPFVVCVCGHAVCGMCSVFLLGDGTRLDVYQELNRRTIVQRVSAALIFPLLIVHLKTFDLLTLSAEAGSWLGFVLLVLQQLGFYVVVVVHMASSLTRALITLGVLGDRQMQRKLDRVVYAVSAIGLLLAAFVIVRTQLAMFL